MKDEVTLQFSYYELTLYLYKDHHYYEGYLFYFPEFPDESSRIKILDSLVTKKHITHWDNKTEQFQNERLPYTGVFMTVHKVYKEQERDEEKYKKCVYDVFHFPKFLYNSLPSIRLKRLLGEER